MMFIYAIDNMKDVILINIVEFQLSQKCIFEQVRQLEIVYQQFKSIIFAIYFNGASCVV